MITAAEHYDDLVQLVREGFLPLECEARSLARDNGLPIQPLDNALKDAYRTLFSAYVNDIAGGRTTSAPRAYQIAHEFGLRTEEVDFALRQLKSDR
jgi:hypothetical protein